LADYTKPAWEVGVVKDIKEFGEELYTEVPKRDLATNDDKDDVKIAPLDEEDAKIGGRRYYIQVCILLLEVMIWLMCVSHDIKSSDTKKKSC